MRISNKTHRHKYIADTVWTTWMTCKKRRFHKTLFTYILIIINAKQTYVACALDNNLSLFSGCKYYIYVHQSRLLVKNLTKRLSLDRAIFLSFYLGMVRVVDEEPLFRKKWGARRNVKTNNDAKRRFNVIAVWRNRTINCPVV